MDIKRVFLFVFLASPTLSFSAEFFTCTVDGKKVFQDSPCDQSKKISCDKSYEYYSKNISRGDYSSIDRKCSKILYQQKLARELAQKQKDNKFREEQERILSKQKSERDMQRRIDGFRKAAENGNYYVEYYVSGVANSANLTYTNKTGGTEQHSVSLPWIIGFETGETDFLYLSAQNNGRFGNVEAQILINLKPVKSSTASSEYGIATVSLP